MLPDPSMPLRSIRVILVASLCAVLAAALWVQPAHGSFSVGAASGTPRSAEALVLSIVASTADGSLPFDRPPSRGTDEKELAKAHVSSSSDRGFAQIARSFEDFVHWGVVLRLLLGMALAVGCAWAIAWHPRRSTKVDPLADLEERKTLVLLGLVGSVVAALVTAHASQAGDSMAQYLAFVIFGIGALMRFRTALNNPKLTGKAILVVVIGIACGLNEWALALYVTLTAFALIFWLDSHVACRVKVSLPPKADLDAAGTAIKSTLLGRRCRVVSASADPAKSRVTVLVHMPSHLDPIELVAAIRAALPVSDPAPGVEVKVG